jgi:hypothetical protein
MIVLNRCAPGGVCDAVTHGPVVLASRPAAPTAGAAGAATASPTAADGPPDADRLDPADLESAVAAVVSGRAAGTDVTGMAMLLTETLAAVSSLVSPDGGHGPVDWVPFGAVVPVLAGSPGAGASVLAAAITDTLQLAGRCVLLVDAADPARSGLAAATSAEGPWTSAITPQLRIRYSWRQYALLARLESRLPAVSPGMVPPPSRWLPLLDPLHATVVDIGHDGWRATANPVLGAGAWLRRGVPAARPILVVRPTRPSLRHAEQVLTRLDPWVRAGTVSVPCRLVVTGATGWPRGVAGAAGRRVETLLPSALFVPRDQQLEAGGVTEELVGPRVRNALVPLLVEWGLLPPPGRRKGRG